VILDPSAVVALMLREPGHDRLLRAIAEAAVVGIGAPTLVETGMVLTPGSRAMPERC
jgi:ribonuclease VapC